MSVCNPQKRVRVGVRTPQALKVAHHQRCVVDVHCPRRERRLSTRSGKITPQHYRKSEMATPWRLAAENFFNLSLMGERRVGVDTGGFGMGYRWVQRWVFEVWDICDM